MARFLIIIPIALGLLTGCNEEEWASIRAQCDKEFPGDKAAIDKCAAEKFVELHPFLSKFR